MKKAIITVNDKETLRPIKPLHGVNNGPLSIYDGQQFKFDASKFYQEAEIPYVRLHDVEYPYGGELFVDYECIFPNFDADVNDPANYFFNETDRFVGAIFATGSNIIYRLGVSIEGARVKRFIGGPRDYNKFADICLHIIAHYTEGWKRGFTYKGIQWEIWNEPNGTTDMWTAGNEAYADFYAITAKKIKERFPNELVGGPAVSYMTGERWPNCPKLVDALRKKLMEDPTIPMDFFSFHNYACEPEDVVENAKLARQFLIDTHHEDAIIIMDEYNYMIDWDRKDACDFMVTEEAAAFLAANFAAMQDSFVDEACYYSAQVWRDAKRDKSRRVTYIPGKYMTRWNGIYKVNDEGELETLPPFESMLKFNELKKLGTQIKTTIEGDARVYCIGATDGKNAAAYYVNFSAEEVEVTFRGETKVMKPFEVVMKKWTV